MSNFDVITNAGRWEIRNAEEIYPGVTEAVVTLIPNRVPNVVGDVEGERADITGDVKVGSRMYLAFHRPGVGIANQVTVTSKIIQIITK
jgi:hypothetical protein